jgi:predicted P-loop ATPase
VIDHADALCAVGRNRCGGKRHFLDDAQAIDRLQAFYDTLIHREDFPAPLKEVLLYRWLISAIAAVLKPSAFRARGVLTLQGPQSIGKTAWINSLVSDPLLREMVIKLDHHLDAGNKDSILTAVSHWIVEIGELDSSFKKDTIAELYRDTYLPHLQKTRRNMGSDLSFWKNHLLPRFGDKHLEELRRQDVIDAQVEMRNAGYSQRQMQQPTQWGPLGPK